MIMYSHKCDFFLIIICTPTHLNNKFRTPQQIAAQRRLQQTQAQVDEVIDIFAFITFQVILNNSLFLSSQFRGTLSAKFFFNLNLNF